MINLEKVDISNIELQKVEYSKTEELKINHRSKAVLKAKQQVQALANLLRQKVGNALSIYDNSTNNRHYTGNDLVLRAYGNAESKIASTVDFKKIKVTSSVRVHFHLY